MTTFTLDFVLQSVKGTCRRPHFTQFSGIATDTRKAMKGELFIALKGEVFDAHEFLTTAIQQGAVGVMIDRATLADLPALQSISVIVVSDTLKALQDLARAHRRRQRAKIIGVAGSNGKTTSKEFCATVLGAHRRVHFSQGSFNNHWGVPFTLLAIPDSAELAVVEMGMNHAGELALLAQIAEPDICVVTYVGVEHIEHFGSLEKIADAEEEIYLHSPSKATRIFNLDNPFTQKMLTRQTQRPSPAKILRFSEKPPTNAVVDVQLQVASADLQSLQIFGQIRGVEAQIKVPVFGRQNLTNLMVAATVGLASGLSPHEIWQSLQLCKTTWGRNQWLKTKSSVEILFDGYNSNPDSMKALAENLLLIRSAGRKIGIFAEMRELGNLAARYHEEIGHVMGAAGLDFIWFYGPHHQEFARGLKAARFPGEMITQEDFDSSTCQRVVDFLKSGDLVFVKGSRGMQLERFVEATGVEDF